jgi:hypothetical protein
MALKCLDEGDAITVLFKVSHRVDMLSLSKDDVVDVIFNVLDAEAARGGLSPESLIEVLRDMKIIFNPQIQPFHTSDAIRRILAELLSSKQLDMCSAGRLFVPVTPHDTGIEFFRGAWYFTTITGQVKGPFKTEGDAQNEYATLHAKR